MTDLARHIDIGQEVHFDSDSSIASAVFATAAFNVKREATLLVSTNLGFRGLREEGANFVENSGVGSGIGTWRATDGRLVYVNNFIELIQARDGAVSSRNNSRAIEFIGEN